MCVDKGGRDPVVCLGFSSTPTTYRLASGRQVVNEISRPKEFSNSTQVLGVKRIEHQSLLPLHNLCEQIFILGRKIYRQELYIVLINMFILQVFSRWFGFPPSRKVVCFFRATFSPSFTAVLVQPSVRPAHSWNARKKKVCWNQI